MRDEDEHAQGQLEEARREFEAIGERHGAASCLQALGEISRCARL